jgi:hypothetical protein
MTIAMVKNPLELELRCVISGAGMVVTANKFPMPIVVEPNERLMVSVMDGHVVAERVGPPR